MERGCNMYDVHKAFCLIDDTRDGVLEFWQG